MKHLKTFLLTTMAFVVSVSSFSFASSFGTTDPNVVVDNDPAAVSVDRLNTTSVDLDSDMDDVFAETPTSAGIDVNFSSDGSIVPRGTLYVIGLIWSLVGLFFFIFWIVMLVDAIKHENKDKALWIILLIFANALGAIIYYFVVRRPRKKLEKQGGVTEAPKAEPTPIA